jgi:hypothetical protein
VRCDPTSLDSSIRTSPFLLHGMAWRRLGIPAERMETRFTITKHVPGLASSNDLQLQREGHGKDQEAREGQRFAGELTGSVNSLISRQYHNHHSPRSLPAHHHQLLRS